MQIPNTSKNVMPALETSQRLASKWFIGLHDVLRSTPSRIGIALTHRNFRLLWMGALTSSIGTWMQRVAQAWLIVTITGSSSAFFLGWIAFSASRPFSCSPCLAGYSRTDATGVT